MVVKCIFVHDDMLQTKSFLVGECNARIIPESIKVERRHNSNQTEDLSVAARTVTVTVTGRHFVTLIMQMTT